MTTFFTEKEIKTIYNQIDTNKTGKIDQEQFYIGFNKFFPQYEKKTVISMFKMADKDKSKTLELPEFIYLIRFIEKKSYEDDPYIILFDQCDLDKNGTLDRREFKLICKCIDETVSKDLIEKLFDDADKDGNGVIDFQEYMEMCAKIQRQNK